MDFADQRTLVDMPINNPNGNNPREESWNVADMLRDCFLCGIIFVDSSEQRLILGGDAAQILGWKSQPKEPCAIEVLPEPLRALTRELANSSKVPADCTVEIDIAGHGSRLVRITPVSVNLERGAAGLALVVRALALPPHFEQRIQQLARLAAMGTLSAGIAHEIKNALVASKTFVDLLLERHQDAELVQVVRRDLSRIDSLVTRTLRFARVGKQRFTSLRLHEVLGNSLRLVQPHLETKLISLRRSFQAAPDLLRGDDHQLQQVFLNLFLNASEAMDNHGTLSVATETVHDTAQVNAPRGSLESQLRVTITDTGPGIAPETMRHLFEPFFTTKPRGTGLGLPIVWRIIQEHRGTISVDSQPGKGTIFCVLLPGLQAS